MAVRAKKEAEGLAKPTLPPLAAAEGKKQGGYYSTILQYPQSGYCIPNAPRANTAAATALVGQFHFAYAHVIIFLPILHTRHGVKPFSN